MKHKILLVVLSLCLLQGAWGQSAQKLREQYEYAKSLIDQEKYLQAIEVLRPLTLPSKNNYLIHYATHLSAVGAYRLGELDIAKETLQSLLASAQEWNKLDESRFLLGTVLFDQGQYLQALNTLDSIRNSSFKEQIFRLKQQKALSFSADQLSLLLRKHPTDTALGEALLNKLEAMPEDQIDLDTYLVLVEEFGTDGREYRHVPKVVFKESYNVAVMLPFYNQLTDPTRLRSNNWFVYDLYQGILMGQELLAEEGISINLFAFDTEKSTEKTQSILKDSVMKEMDLIIGPLYAQSLPAVMEFSKENGIAMVNPISNNPKAISDNPYSYLIHPSYYTLGRKVANYALDSLRDDGAFIVYGGSEEERTTAKAYKEQYEERGGKVMAFEQFNYSADGFKQLLSTFDTLKPDSLGLIHFNGHVFASVKSEIPAVNIVSALHNLRTKAPVLIPEEWIRYQQLTLRQIESVNALMVAPQQVNYNLEGTRKIARRYIEAYAEAPTSYAYGGLEAIYLFGRLMHQFGTGFQEELHQIPGIPGSVYVGYNYQGYNDNQYVPILNFRLVEGSTELLNRPDWAPASKDVQSSVSDK